MKILVDADACPVKEIIVRVSGELKLDVCMVADPTHILDYPNNSNVRVITVDKGADSADLAIANLAAAGDICVTADYGLAAMLLAKRAVVLHPNGFFYTSDNIDRMLFERHISREMRRQKKGRGGHIAKREKADDLRFYEIFKKACMEGR